MEKTMFKYAALIVSVGIVLLTSGISGCLPDPYSVGEPDSLFSEYVLVWDLVDSHYACFFARENVDWDQVHENFKPIAENLANRQELADVCLDMLGALEDPNLALRDSVGARLESWNQGCFINWDLVVWQDYMRDIAQISFAEEPGVYDALLFYLTHSDTAGYVYISDLGDPFSWVGFFTATGAVQDYESLIIDLRMCGESGNSINAYYACGRFIEESGPGYYRVFRAGPGRNDMGPMQEVMAYRNGAWQFTGPIILLTGRFTQGTAEQLVLLLKTQDHVTVIGDTTAGFANPTVTFNLTENWSLEIPEMVTYSLDTTLIFNSGIAPDIFIPVSEADFAAGIDPVLDAAIEMILR